MTPAGLELRSGEVDYTLEDLRELARLSKLLRIARIFGWVLLVVAILTFASSRLLGTPYSLADFLYCLFVVLVLQLYGSPTVRAHIWRWLIRRSRFYGSQTFVVRDAGFEIISSLGHSEINWPVFARIVRKGDRLFLFVTKGSAYIVPRRAFDSDAEFEAFSVSARERWEARERP
jgi:hypothetical protein